MKAPRTSEAVLRERSGALIDSVCYVVLTILVWGISALRRGMWQDDVQALGTAVERSRRSFFTLFRPDASPLRRLTVLPSALANATPYPVEALQILSAGTWLAIGLLAGWIVSLLFPGRRWTRFVVVCLTLTATSDYQTASMVPLAYNVAAAALLAAIGCALLWLRRGGRRALVLSAVLLASSLLTMDVAIPAMPFALVLFVQVSGWRPAKNLIWLLGAWAAVLIPIAIVEWSFLHDPSSYAAIAMLPLSLHAFAHRTIKLWIENFEPWRWAFARPEWYPRPPAAISTAWRAFGSLVAVVVFWLRLRQKKDDGGRGSQIFLVLLFVAMTVAANAAYAGIQMSDIHYRTHILSRVWASAAIGILAGWLMERRPGMRLAGLTLASAFVFFGTWGGIERQDLYLATWRQHQRELASILTAAPSLRPGTRVILRSDATPDRYLATEADYLTTHWLRLLYDAPFLLSLRVAPDRGTRCSAVASGLECRGERGESYHFRYEEMVVMDYDHGSGTYRLVRSLNGDPFSRGHEAGAALYRPEDRIINRPWTVRQRRLLLLR